MGTRSTHRRRMPAVLAQSFDTGAPVVVEGRTMTAVSGGARADGLRGPAIRMAGDAGADR